MLPRRARLLKEDIPAIIARGRAYNSSTLTLKISATAGPAAFTVVVANKITAPAAARNRLKRRIRHLLAKHLPLAPAGRRGIFFAKPPARAALSKYLEKDILYLLRLVQVIE